MPFTHHDVLEINENLLHRCNHPRHTTETQREYGSEIVYLICIECGEYFYDPDSQYHRQPKSRQPEGYCSKFVPNYAFDIVMARKLLRMLENEFGWKSFIRTVNGVFTCTLRLGEQNYAGDGQSSEEKAIISAALKASRSV